LVAAACGYYRVTPKAVEHEQLKAPQAAEITTPAKAHLKDGGVVLFPNGFRLEGNVLKGSGERYDLTRQSHTPVQEIALSDVAALEHYEKELQSGKSTAASAGCGVGTVLGIAGAAVLFKAIFGSCPTVYSLDGGRVLEAELFSHSISRRFEAEDLDLLSDVLLREGGYRLLVANEAPETHYINRLTLEVVDHPAGTRAFPSPDDRVLVFEGDLPFQALNRRGEDVTAALAARDESPYRTDLALTRELAKSIAEDWVELIVPVPSEGRSKAPVVVLRLRNTLMATVLLYDVMLKSQGVKALEWLGSDTLDPLYAWRIYRWFDRRYSLQVEAWDGEHFVNVASVSPTGPIAWHDVAVELPPAQGPEARVRISFLPDNWMLDWASVGLGIVPALATRSIAPAKSEGLSGDCEEAVIAPLREADGSYLITSPGESHTLFFPAEAPSRGTSRTCFLRSRGFYIEWLREEWFQNADTVAAGPVFEPNDAVVVQTARLWLERKDDLERRFAETKIPLAGGAR